MRFRSIALTFVALASATTLRAQGAPISASCPAGNAQQTAVQDACQLAVDLFQYMKPQLGIAIAGGNATLGQGGALGGLPHFTIGIRGNVLQGSIPDVPQPRTSGASPARNITTKDQILGLPAVDASIGLFKGLPFGVTNIGGIDLLLSASYVPEVNSGDVTVSPDTPIEIGYGARIGLIQESLLVPGVAVTFLKRGLPKTTITGVASGTNDSVTVRDLDLKTTAWRITASKSLVLFTLAAGAGQDKYDASTTIEGVVHGIPVIGRSPFGPFALSDNKTMTRTNYFADLSINLMILKLIGEVGMVSGGEALTYNNFDTKADKSLTYGSLGIRIGF